MSLNADAILDYLNFPAVVKVFDEVDSTNAFLKRHIADFPVDRISLVVSDSQSAGYGKFHRSFFSPADSGVYFSVLLPIDLISDVDLVTLSAGVSVCSALKKLVPEGDFSLKWVNNVLNGDRKCGGVLAESISDDDGKLTFVVLGIGVDVFVESFPDELADVAGDVGAVDLFDRNFFVGSVLNFLLDLLDNPDSVVPDFRLLCSTVGQRVEVVAGGRRVIGKAVDVDDSGGLVVVDDKKNRHLFNSGEVSKVFL
ncbi:biotin--[acetyl-CoA-carboxylase] ligase [Companilactobacillus furfuricola]|uniref:biotin--[acetyl-CoA-carboxylase] ligase n=1 Tax=Companilactobacillus furfuricola TaxID=1462575 RepID=UPI0013DDD9CA|nr:biotin--[acetyl-CoA-carboxylase] ligase [Companilactobacillus furfuricola]